MEMRWDSRRHPKYRLAVVKANGEALPVDEPLFVLRARDPLGAVCVRQYAALKQGITEERDYGALLELASEMEEYRDKRLPDPTFEDVSADKEIADLMRDQEVPGWVREAAEIGVDHPNPLLAATGFVTLSQLAKSGGLCEVKEPLWGACIAHAAAQSEDEYPDIWLDILAELFTARNQEQLVPAGG